MFESRPVIYQQVLDLSELSTYELDDQIQFLRVGYCFVYLFGVDQDGCGTDFIHNNSFSVDLSQKEFHVMGVLRFYNDAFVGDGDERQSP